MVGVEGVLEEGADSFAAVVDEVEVFFDAPASPVFCVLEGPVLLDAFAVKVTVFSADPNFIVDGTNLVVHFTTPVDAADHDDLAFDGEENVAEFEG